MTEQRKPNRLWQWLKDNNVQLGSIAYLLTITTLICGGIGAIVLLAKPYMAIILSTLSIVIAIAILVGQFIQLHYIWRQVAASRSFAVWTRFILIALPLVIFWVAGNEYSRVSLAILTSQPGYSTAMGVIVAYGVIITYVLLALMVVILIARFYWDTHVRLQMLEEIMREGGKDPVAMRKLYFVKGWEWWRGRRWTILRVAAPGDLKYVPTTGHAMASNRH